MSSEFLSAMSSSRSVTQCVCSRVAIFLLNVLEVSSSPEVFQWLFQGCLKFKGSFKDVSKKFIGYLQKVSKDFP